MKSVALVLSFLLLACGGGGAKTFYMHRNTTLGQELEDLQEAYQKGALTGEEYEVQRAKLLKGEMIER